jgi:hypothetical protein
VAGLDGRRPLHRVVEAAARRAGATPEALAAECLPTLGELLARGLLVVASGG